MNSMTSSQAATNTQNTLWIGCALALRCSSISSPRLAAASPNFAYDQSFIQHETGRFTALGDGQHALWQIPGAPDRRPARCLSRVVCPQRFSAWRAGQLVGVDA